MPLADNGTPGFVYRVIRDFGFPVLVSIALGWWIVRQDDITRADRREGIALQHQQAALLQQIDKRLETMERYFPSGPFDGMQGRVPRKPKGESIPP